jgi:hypothetical protein
MMGFYFTSHLPFQRKSPGLEVLSGNISFFITHPIITGVLRTHEHLGPAMDWGRFLNIAWEQRLDEARWLKPTVSEATF